jgi:hypothetical protein
MKILILSFFLLPFSFLFSQGNLQFNQVLTYGGTLNAGLISTNNGNYQYSSPAYTVPSGKVWKIESVMSVNSIHMIVNNLAVGNMGSGQSPTFPLWLKAGDVLRFAYSSSSANTYFFSGIEFNIIP